MQTQYFIVEPSFGCPFRTEVIRFLPRQSYDDGLTLLFMHATNLFKEAWTPLISELLATSSPLRVKDIWSMDNPNHGRSAGLNRTLLLSEEHREKWTPWENAKAAYALLSTHTHEIDFSNRNLVLVSQSGGSSAAVLLQKMHPELLFQGFILLDPVILPPTNPLSLQVYRHFTKFALLKSDMWASVEDARQELLKKGGFRNFAPAVFESFLECALRPLGQTNAVTLACTKVHDFVFHGSDELISPPAEALTKLCKEDRFPVYLIVPSKDEFKGILDIPRAFQVELVRKANRGYVHIIERGGHLFPQSEPVLTARHVRTALMKICDQGAARL